METYNTNAAICPYCGHKNAPDNSDGALYDEDTENYDCESCGKTFRLSVYVSYSYTCWPID